jgi:hypothetical protein
MHLFMQEDQIGPKRLISAVMARLPPSIITKKFLVVNNLCSLSAGTTPTLHKHAFLLYKENSLFLLVRSPSSS